MRDYLKLKRDFEDLQRKVLSPTPYVSKLPENPYDGQEIYYVADSTNGVIWHLRHNTASASAYKWEGAGRQTPLVAENTANTDTTTSDTLTTISNAPSMTLPLAGVYDITCGFAGMLAGAASGGAAIARPAYNGTAIGAEVNADTDANLASDANRFTNVSSTLRLTIATASQTLDMRGRRGPVGGAGSGGTAYFTHRSLRATPIRVG